MIDFHVRRKEVRRSGSGRMVVGCNLVHLGIWLTAFRRFDVEGTEGKGVKREI